MLKKLSCEDTHLIGGEGREGGLIGGEGMRVGWDGVGRRWCSVDCDLKMNVLGKKMMK